LKKCNVKLSTFNFLFLFVMYNPEYKLSRRTFLKSMAIGAATTAFPVYAGGTSIMSQTNEKRPNILHIFTDQQRFDTIGAINNPTIKTPNLNRLCENGVIFTNAFTPCPVCVAARCSMVYGQYPMNTDCYENTLMPTDGRQSLMDALAEAGYRTHGIGKCHFSPDSYALRGFQSRERQEEGGSGDIEKEPYFKAIFDAGYKHIMEAFGIRGEMYYIPQPSQLPSELHPSQWVGDRSTDFIKQANSDQPWYLFSSFIHPHPPFTPPNPWHKLYRAAMMPLPKIPDDVESLQTYVNKCQNRYKYRDQGIDKNLLRCMKANYYACISFIDFQIGRMLEMLESTGQLDNTLILFTSDHGEHLGDNNCFGKRSMHDSCARIPFIVSMPRRFEGGKTCDVPVNLVDVAPTFLGAAGTSFKSHQPDGIDVADILSGSSNRKMVFAQHSYARANPLGGNDNVPQEYIDDPEVYRAAMSQYMAVSREWKYFYSAADDREFLFDKIHDPLETRNKAGIVFTQKTLAEMRNVLFEHLKQGGEVKGIEGNKWRKFPKPEFPSDPDTGLLIQDGYTPWTNTFIPGYSDK
jgi:arylsulfatase